MALSEDIKIPPKIICFPDVSYARDLQAQGACALRFFSLFLPKIPVRARVQTTIFGYNMTYKIKALNG